VGGSKRDSGNGKRSIVQDDDVLSRLPSPKIDAGLAVPTEGRIDAPACIKSSECQICVVERAIASSEYRRVGAVLQRGTAPRSAEQGRSLRKRHAVAAVRRVYGAVPIG